MSLTQLCLQSRSLGRGRGRGRGFGRGQGRGRGRGMTRVQVTSLIAARGRRPGRPPKICKLNYVCLKFKLKIPQGVKIGYY